MTKRSLEDSGNKGIIYTVMFIDENAAQNHNIKLDNKSFERVEQFKSWNNPNVSKFHS